MKKLVFCLICAFIAVACASTQESGRFALVIGNGKYTELPKLANPANDATDIAAALESLGFTTDLLIDADLNAMEDAVIELGSRLASEPAATGFFYYAGHGVQAEGTNYLIPCDAHIPSESFLKTKALAAQTVLDSIQQAKNELNIVVLDACRDNPFGWSRSGGRGLSVVSAQPPGSIIVYATSTGSVAQDGSGRNGVFTQELLKNLTVPGVEIKDVFNRTGAGVKSVTSGVQIPAVYGQFFDTAYLAGAPPKIGALELSAHGKAISLVLNGKTLSGASEGGGKLSFSDLPSGSGLDMKLTTNYAATPFNLSAFEVPDGGTATLDTSEYRSWLRSSLEAERNAYLSALSEKKTRTTIGVAALVSGAVGAIAAGTLYALGMKAGKDYEVAQDTLSVALARKTIELSGSLFPVAASVGGVGLSLSGVMFLIGPSPTTLRHNVESIDAQIEELKHE